MNEPPASTRRRGATGKPAGATSSSCSAARACGTLRYYPRAVCPECLSGEARWERMSGRGTVYTFTVTYQNQSPGFREELPYVLAYVTLDEGVQMLTNVVGCPPDQVKIGMPVEVTFEDVNDEIAIPRFKPVAS